MRATVAAAMVACIAMAACGGGDGNGDAESGGGMRTQASGPSATTKPAATAATEAPKFISEFKRVCTTQVGFGGVAGYEAAPGLHPVVFFEDHRGEGFVESAMTLPAGWAVEQDTNFEDNTELKAAQLIACADRVKETPTGIKCEFDDDGQKVELELVDSVYDLKVYAATTGELKHQQTLEAKNTECPFFASFKKGDKTFVNEPSDEDYINALKLVVAP